MNLLHNSWDQIFKLEFSKSYFKDLDLFIESEYKEQSIHPDYTNIFNAFKLTEFDDVKVVIIGQDPYHGQNQANGLAFSVSPNCKIPPSLRNIYKEIFNDLAITPPLSGDLSYWAKQGVLLLNTVLTVRNAQPNSHKAKGWEQFTNSIIYALNNKTSPIVFLLWGNQAKSIKKLITNPLHTVLTSAHPSPLSAYNGFLGCKHFSKTNEILIKNSLTPIDWGIT